MNCHSSAKVVDTEFVISGNVYQEYNNVFLLSPVSQFVFIPPPTAYNNSPIRDPIVTCIDQFDAMINADIRICPGNGLLGDTDLGSAELDTSKVFAWNTAVSIAFTFTTTQVNQVNLFFYNIPSSGVGLPPAELYWSNSNPRLPDRPLSHVIVGNQDLSQNDSTLRNVSLVVTGNQPQDDYRYIGIRFTFPAETSLIDWILLSEFQLCEEAGVCVCRKGSYQLPSIVGWILASYPGHVVNLGTRLDGSMTDSVLCFRYPTHGLHHILTTFLL